MNKKSVKNTVPKEGLVGKQVVVQANKKARASTKSAALKMEKETGGVSGPEPTRYGDWEHKGRCYDF